MFFFSFASMSIGIIRLTIRTAASDTVLYSDYILGAALRYTEDKIFLLPTLCNEFPQTLLPYSRIDSLEPSLSPKYFIEIGVVVILVKTLIFTFWGICL